MTTKKEELKKQAEATCGEKTRSWFQWLCNCDEGTFMGRTPGSWAKIGLFYLIFYSCLAGFFAAMLNIFFLTMTPGRPTLIEYQSLIKYNPGMGFRPQPNVERTSIIFKQGQRDTYQHYIDNMQAFMEEYNNTRLPECRGDDADRDPNQACRFDLGSLGEECTYARDFGYDEGRPCVLLKMNKVYNWEPEDYDNDTVPEEMGGRYMAGNVGVTCEGEEAADRDNIGEVKIYPSAGYSSMYFPYTNQPDYLQPLVMVQFANPQYGALIQVWCKVWAKNIYHDRNDRAGSVHFEILVD